MKQWLFGLCVLVGLMGTGCSALTDSLNRRAGTDPRDMEIRLEIMDRLQRDHLTARQAISVSVQEGVVMLRGTVPDDMTRHRVRTIAVSVPGVLVVEDQLSR